MRNLRIIVLLKKRLVLSGKYFSVIRMLSTKNVTSFSFASSESAFDFHRIFFSIEKKTRCYWASPCVLPMTGINNSNRKEIQIHYILKVLA